LATVPPETRIPNIEIRNPKSEIRNKSESRRRNVRNGSSLKFAMGNAVDEPSRPKAYDLEKRTFVFGAILRKSE
jgi:hypothetical protein